DVFAIVSTTFGVATSLGFGVDQINSGLNYLFGVPDNELVQIGLIIVTTGIATVSVVLGLDKGIKRLSEINIALAVLLLIAVLSVGPTVLLLQALMQNTGGYLTELVSKTFNLYAYEPTDWLGGWTIFYWGWWISWSPFVGLFIARISRGRTLRQFVLGALLGPVAFTFAWMTVFGNSAIDLIMNQGVAELGAAVQADESVALFHFFEHFPATELLSILAIVMVVVFFVTSADSGALVLNMLCSNGSDYTPIGRLVGIWGFGKALYVDHAKRQSLLAASGASISATPDTSWQDRLTRLLRHPRDAEVARFLRERVHPAMEEFCEELRRHGLDARVTSDPATAGSVRLEIAHGDELDFVYEVVNREHPLPDGALVGRAMDEMSSEETYHRAEVHLSEGGQDYDIMGWTSEQIAYDMTEQYERHRHFLHVLR
ncbi:MAG: BCCT family transporter, partial [Gammaproteobacteria bacterium]